MVRAPRPRFAVASLALLALSACADDRGVGGELGETSEALTASCPPNPDPFAGPVQGIDISKYQTVSSWAKVAASENFVIIKATEASSVDPSFASHRAGAKGTNLTVGYYHYLRFSSSGVAQANTFINAIGKLEADELPPMLDIEDSAGAANNTTAENIKIVQDWLDTVEAAFGKRPFIYTGGGFWGGANFGNPAQFATYYFCWSRYSSSNTCPQVPDNLVPRIKMWQYRADAFPQFGIPAGQTDGITGAVDQDVFYGDMAEFKSFLGPGTTTGPEYAAKYSKQSYPLAAAGAVDVKVGETVTGYIEMTNTGSATWSPGKVFLAPIPRDVASPYRAPSWVSATRVSTVDKDVAPGQIGHFALDIAGSAPGDGSLKLGWVAEGITWFADAPKGGGPEDGVAEVKVHVTAGAAGGAAGASNGGAAGASTGGKGGGSAGSAGGAGAATGGTGGAAGGKTAGSGGAAPIAGAAQAAGASGAPAGATVLPANDDGGCGCRVPRRDDGGPWWLAAAGVGVFAARRRRARA